MNTTAISSLPTSEHQKNFYPTPRELAEKLLDGLDWNRVESVLEPSAGKGDLAMYAIEKLAAARYRTGNMVRPEDYDVDCVEIDPDLRALLKGKGLRVVHDDFLTFATRKRYHLILMNPPFDRGAEHLLKAISLLEPYGGQIACILNAETLRNLCTRPRLLLKQRLDELGADVRFVKEAFLDAERPASVDVALIRLTAPEPPQTSVILDNLRRAQVQREASPDLPNDLAVNDFVQAIVDCFDLEADAGVALIREYRALCPYMLDSREDYAHSILDLTLHGSSSLSENEYLRRLRRKYWSVLFADPRFTRRMTSNVQSELFSNIDRMMDYDFSVSNILQLQADMVKDIGEAIEQTILELFDDWTHKYHWDEASTNIHYYNGWRTNDAFAVNRKVIQPFYLDAWNSWSGKFQPTDYRVMQKLCDIEKVFDYLSGTESSVNILQNQLRLAEQYDKNRNIPLRYFKVSLYKKRTLHIEFTDLDVLHRFNIFAGRKKNWLPPCYGKKRYCDMTPEEKAVVDSFEGEESYNRVVENPPAFLTWEDGTLPPLALAGNLEPQA